MVGYACFACFGCAAAAPSAAWGSLPPPRALGHRMLLSGRGRLGRARCFCSPASALLTAFWAVVIAGFLHAPRSGLCRVRVC
eukprot:13031476-Alexandrium_andersonii.AAC.1